MSAKPERVDQLAERIVQLRREADEPIAELFHLTYPELVRCAESCGSRRQDAEEVAERAFNKSIDKYNPEKKSENGFLSFARLITRQEAYAHHRKYSGREPRQLGDETEPIGKDDVARSLRESSPDVAVMIVRDAILSLPPDECLCFLFRYYMGYRAVDSSEFLRRILGKEEKVPVGTVNYKLHQAKRRLSNILGNEFVESLEEEA